MKAKGKVQDTFATVFGVKIDSADGTGHSGNTLTGKLAKRFFSQECRALLHKIVKKQQLDHVKEIHFNLEVILRVITSSNNIIEIDKFLTLCNKTYTNILSNFKWADITPTLHKVLAHAPELIEKNLCLGLGKLSEEGLEA